MYIDVNGKRGYRMLVGASGKTYSNAKLLTLAERDDMLADGITEYVPPPPAPEPPEHIERRRKRSIRAMAVSRVGYHVLGDLDDGDDQLLKTLVELTLALTDTVKDLVAAGVVTPAQLNNRIKQLNNKATDIKAVRQAMADAVTNGDDIATFEAALDAIIAPPVQP